MQRNYRKLLPLLTLLASCLMPILSFANTINMYDEPKAQAKITGTIDLSAGIIPIFSPKNSDWIKVADPRNGNTGWVKNSEIKDSKGNVVSFSQQYSQGGKQGSSMQMQFGNQTMTPEQRKAAEEKLKSAQESLIKLQENFSQSIVNLNKVYQQEVENMGQTGVVLRPIVINPQQMNTDVPASGLQKPGDVQQ